MNKVRWGILSTAGIARKNWKAIRNSGNSTVTAVASRNLERSRKFIEDNQNEAPMEVPPIAFGSYEELLASKEVDAVYIPLPTGLRADWVIRAAKVGKHVVCEKPCASSLKELRSMLNACKRKKVQFMDGVMFTHSRRLEKLRAEINAGKTGEIKRITSAFSFHADSDFYRNNIRANSVLEPFGCLGDLGWYCIRLALWIMEERMPLRVSGKALSEVRGRKSPAAVATEFSGELFFDGGTSSSFYCSFSSADEQWAMINGTKGLIRIQDFVLPYFGSEVSFEVFNAGLKVTGCDFNMEPGRRHVAIPEYSNSHATSQETNLFRTFAAQVQSGQLNDEWPEMALRTQAVMEACLQSARTGSALVRL